MPTQSVRLSPEIETILGGIKESWPGAEYKLRLALEAAAADATKVNALQNLTTVYAQRMNRAVHVEQMLLDAVNGKRPVPDATQCRALALRLGDPDKGWLAIETAPRDHTEIWLGAPGHMMIGYWGYEEDRTPQAELWVDWAQRSFTGMGSPRWTPTKWQPLPKPIPFP